MWQALQQCPPPLRWLLCANFFFNLAFYMLVPYLAWHLRENLLLSASLVGLLLGARHLAQQGFFILGGLLADFWSHKRTLLLGCWLRAASLILLGINQQVAFIAFAVVLMGFSAALFTPAAQALLVSLNPLSGKQIFALASAFRSAGELIGPLLGLLLMNWSFAHACNIAALPFALFAIILMRLPEKKISQKSQEAWPHTNTLYRILGNVRFIAFCICMTGYFLLINQLSFLLPLALQERGGDTTWVAALFFCSAAAGIFLQVLITQWCERHLRASTTIRLGFLLMGFAFLLPLMSAEKSWLSLLSIILAGLLLTLGMLMCYPIVMHQIARFSKDTHVASHYGIFYFFAGIGMAAGNALLGLLMDKFPEHPIIWWSMAFLAVGVVFCVQLQARDYDQKIVETVNV